MLLLRFMKTFLLAFSLNSLSNLIFSSLYSLGFIDLIILYTFYSPSESRNHEISLSIEKPALTVVSC